MPIYDPDPYGPYERSYNVEMLQTEVFGAFHAVSEFRKNDVGMTNIEIARRTGGSRSLISKLLASPQNWTLKTISELATAFDVDFKFVLIDRTDSTRCFNAGGLALNTVNRTRIEPSAMYSDLSAFPSKGGLNSDLQKPVVRGIQGQSNFDPIELLTETRQGMNVGETS